MRAESFLTHESLLALRSARARNAEALLGALREGDGETPSERVVADHWHRRLKATPGLLPEGWYLPPPHGIILYSHGDLGRVQPPSFRPAETWPREDRLLTEDRWLYGYASPVDRRTGMIGDFGTTLFRTDSAEVGAHLARCWSVTTRIARSAQPGMAYRELYALAEQLIRQEGLQNIVQSVADPSSVNIGHTIPWSDGPMAAEERAALDSGEPEQVARAVSRRRLFVSAEERSPIPATGAFTVEPRLSAQGCPNVSFHLTVIFQEGRGWVDTESFGPLFRHYGMDRWLGQLSSTDR